MVIWDAMKGARILFYDPDSRVQRAAERALLATGAEVDVVGDEDSLLERIEIDGYDLNMINFDPPMRQNPRWRDCFERFRVRFPKTRLVLHATARTEDYLPLLAEHRYVRNLIAKNDNPLEADELIVTAEKILRGDMFGLEKYMLWGIAPYRIEVRDSRLKTDYVREVSSYAERLGCNERVVENIETVVDELVTNAIYNAPRDSAGKPKYAKLSRRETVVLGDEEVGTLEFACDGNFIAMSLADPFGALTQDTIVNYLNRCLVKSEQQISDASGGAGLGLYRVFSSLSKFIVNIDPGKRTEVISLIDLRLSMKQFRTLPKSFHIFIADEGTRRG